jgi:hypothetical protein
MKLCSTKIYLEVGIKFNISHKVNKLMMKYLTENVMEPFGLVKIDPDVFLNLQVTTKESYSKLSVFKPYKVEDDFLTYQLRLPYHEINNSDRYLEEYIEYFFEGASEAFSHFEVPRDNVMDVKEKVKSEVLENNEYEYVETYVSKVDTSKYDF